MEVLIHKDIVWGQVQRGNIPQFHVLISSRNIVDDASRVMRADGFAIVVKIPQVPAFDFFIGKVTKRPLIDGFEDRGYQRVIHGSFYFYISNEGGSGVIITDVLLIEAADEDLTLN